MNFTITPKAAKFIRMMIMADGGPGAGFRLAVSPGGCSGLAAEIAVKAEPRSGRRGGRRAMASSCSCRPKAACCFDGVTIDFAETPTSTGLVFLDPKAQATCGSH